MSSDMIDYLMGQPDGANYVVLYQMLCLKTINTGGRLAFQIGDMIIPYDVEKIQRESILFTVKDGNLTYRMSKTFTISDTLFNKIKNIFKNMHYLWLQFFFRDLVEGGKLAALGYKMPDIPESGGQQDAPRENEPDSSNLPGEAEPLEEVDAEELDDAEEPAADELTKATEIARQNGGVTQAMLEQQMGVTAEKAIALLDDMESAGVIEFSNGHYTIAAADSEEE